jgi:ComF family protein
LLAQREAETRTGDAVIAVPLSFEREAERGYNQSMAIARAYARALQLPLFASPLLRVRHAPAQQSLAREDRRRNVRGAFGVNGSLDAATVVVIDDVMTTGSTLDEIAATLKRAGVARVINRVIARTP